MKHLIIFLAALLPLIAVADVTSTRVTSYDWRCTPTDTAKAPSDHQRFDTAFLACLNQGGGIVQGGQYKVATSSAAPSTTTINWQAPTQYTDGSPITSALTYRVETQSGAQWVALAMVATLTYTAPGTTGCWRVIAIEGATQSDPTNAVCR